MQQLCLFMMKLAQPSLNQDKFTYLFESDTQIHILCVRRVIHTKCHECQWTQMGIYLGAYAPSWLFLVPSSLDTKINIHFCASRFIMFWLGYIFIQIKKCIWHIKLKGILSLSWIKPVWAPWFSKMYVIFNFVTTPYVIRNFSFILEIENIKFEFIVLTSKIQCR
jgi:hypothetical protein